MLLDLGVGEVLLTSNSAGALALLEREAVDIGLIDLLLGSETSLPVADRLVERSIPFALFSGYDDPRELVARFPQVPLLQKPFALAELVALLDQLC